jgi:sporulation protein YlmC with PRC-barrel domain
MIRKLLATTAIATLVATGAAMAQTTAPAPATTAPMEAAPQVKPADGHLASNLIGETVYNGTSDDAENIGEVNDLVLNNEGQVEAIVVGVGGFLGIGQKSVALEFDLIEWAEMDGDEYIVVETTREALDAQPDFDLDAYEFQSADAEVGNTTPATAEDLAAAPVADEDAAATDDMAAAPADDATAPADDSMAAAPADDETAPADDSMAAAPADEEAAPADDSMAAAPMEDDAAATDNTETAAIDRTTLTDVEEADIRAEDFVGTTVYGANDENVGEIGDVILSQDGNVEAVIVDVGGFLGMGEKEVAVSMENLAFLSDEDGTMYLYTDFTQEQLEAQAEYDESTYADARDDQLLIVPVQ